jgi:hypothetical protein
MWSGSGPSSAGSTRSPTVPRSRCRSRPRHAPGHPASTHGQVQKLPQHAAVPRAGRSPLCELPDIRFRIGCLYRPAVRGFRASARLARGEGSEPGGCDLGTPPARTGNGNCVSCRLSCPGHRDERAEVTAATDEREQGFASGEATGNGPVRTRACSRPPATSTIPWNRSSRGGPGNGDSVIVVQPSISLGLPSPSLRPPPSSAPRPRACAGARRR